MRRAVFTWRHVAFSVFLSLSCLGLFLLCQKSLKIPLQGVHDVQSLQGDPRPVKHTHLVVGDAAGQGLAGRVQCKGTTFADEGSKTRDTFESCRLSKAERLSFVTFFMPPPYVELPRGSEEGDNAGIVKLGNVTVSRAERPYVILSIFLKSIQFSNTDSKAIILTDQNSPMISDRIPAGVQLHKIAKIFSRNNLMLQRLESYVSFLEELLAKLRDRKHRGDIDHIIFMDTDILVVADLRCLFETYRDFDIALTFRNNKYQPINSGVLMIRGEIGSVSRARGFLMDVVKAYREKFAHAARMLGDQLSLAAILLEHSEQIALRFKKPSIFQFQISRRRFLFLPCQLYNWTPSEGAGQFHGMPENVKVLHFKGSRKRLMIEAWNQFRHSGESYSQMKCLILKSGRAKYDF